MEKLEEKYETNENKKQRNKRKFLDLSVSFVVFRLFRISL
jgi:hypothetical protein